MAADGRSPAGEVVTLRLRRDVARERLHALEELLFEIETLPTVKAAILRDYDATAFGAVLRDVEALREALHAAIYCDAGEGP